MPTVGKKQVTCSHGYIHRAVYNTIEHRLHPAAQYRAPAKTLRK